MPDEDFLRKEEKEHEDGRPPEPLEANDGPCVTCVMRFHEALEELASELPWISGLPVVWRVAPAGFGHAHLTVDECRRAVVTGRVTSSPRWDSTQTPIRATPRQV